MAAQFATRREGDVRYSLRAFARDLGLPPSRLSEMFRGKDTLSVKRAAVVASHLGLEQAERDLFCTLVEAQSRSVIVRERAQAKLDQHRNRSKTVVLDFDRLAAITQWYHVTIVEMAKLHGFLPALPQLAKKLGILPLEAEAAIARLIRLKLLKRDRGNYVARKVPYITANDISSDAIKALHDSMMHRARRALYRQSVESREFTFCQMAVRSSDLPRAKAELRRMRDEFIAKFCAPDDGDQIYCVAMQFFSLLDEPLAQGDSN